MNKILYSAVIYQSDNFDIFMKDYLVSVFNQTDQNFDLLLVLDDLIVEVIKEYIVRYNKNKKNIIYINIGNSCKKNGACYEAPSNLTQKPVI